MNRNGSSRRSMSVVTSLCLVAAMFVLALGPTLAAEGKAAKPAADQPSRQIDINKATAVELTAIPGVGSVIAQRIVEFREKQGPYRRVDDLLKVKGIGEKSLERIRPHVKVETDG